MTAPHSTRPAHQLPLEIRQAEAEEKRRIREYFGNRRGGRFIEVGANDPTSPESQSHHLARDLGWTGLLVEPIPWLAELARQERPESVTCEVACTAPGKTGVLDLWIPRDGGRLLTGHAALEANADEHNHREFEKLAVTAVTLADLCARMAFGEVDLLSIDVEGAELDVLQGAGLATLRPRLILLEDKHLYLAKHRFLVRAGYVLAQRHNRNCWYVRRGEPMPPVPWSQRIRLWKRMYVSLWFNKVRYAVRHRTLRPFLAL